MARIAKLGLALAAVLAVIGVGAVPVSAVEHEFVASKTGKTSSVWKNVQVFKTGAGTIECSKVTGTGEITALKSSVHKETLTYTECIAFGFPKVLVTPAHFEFNANGSAKLEKSVTVTPEGSGCEVVIPAQTVESIGYTNESGKLGAEAVVFNIVSKGTGGVCGAENKEGTYTGKILATLEGGTLEWK